MRDIILGRKVGTTNTVVARRHEKRMVEACERRILEFPLGMDAREVAKELKREGWYLGRQTIKVLFSGSSACEQKRETDQRVWPPLGRTILTRPSGFCERSFSDCDNRKEPTRTHGRKTPAAPTG